MTPVSTVPGNLNITGSISAGVKSFKIDHPLDAENKLLHHASIESDEMINIYNGRATTNSDGFVAIQLQDWMNALNKDFKYQLTVVGKDFSHAIVWEEIDEKGSFIVKTSSPKTTVCWQVIGTRHDKYAAEHPLQVVTEKKKINPVKK
jgi:hypothetical protein